MRYSEILRSKAARIQSIVTTSMTARTPTTLIAARKSGTGSVRALFAHQGIARPLSLKPCSWSSYALPSDRNEEGMR
ncbi:MAG: hypothetical protein QJR02_01750 [Sinobacteraceae bacterium]|nr:hypothetical protein [Nevskiaceae bacterium]